MTNTITVIKAKLSSGNTDTILKNGHAYFSAYGDYDSLKQYQDELRSKHKLTVLGYDADKYEFTGSEVDKMIDNLTGGKTK